LIKNDLLSDEPTYENTFYASDLSENFVNMINGSLKNSEFKVAFKASTSKPVNEVVLEWILMIFWNYLKLIHLMNSLYFEHFAALMEGMRKFPMSWFTEFLPMWIPIRWWI
jgi:hypothetical protein